MRFVQCTACRTHLQLGGDPAEIDSLLQGEKAFHCVSAFCSGIMRVVASPCPPGYRAQEMPVRNFYRAIHGFGSGVGAPASFDRAKDLLLSQKVIQVVGEPVGQPERVILRQLVLESGVRLHFDSSSRGACLYYIEEPGPSCREVVERELSFSPNREGVAANREEAGRAPERESCASSQESGGSLERAAKRPKPSMPSVPKSGDIPTSHDPSL